MNPLLKKLQIHTLARKYSDYVRNAISEQLKSHLQILNQ